MERDLASFGIVVGHATDERAATGLTVIRGREAPLRAGVAVFGRATGSRELLAASAEHLVAGRVDAVLLAGGSAYGLDAAAGVMRWMEERGRGFSVGTGVVPIVPAGVIFDLAPLGRFDARPTADMAYAACDRAMSHGFAEGSVGAGAGATVGKVLGPTRAMKGGFGWTVVGNVDARVAAFAVVNALGDVRDASDRIIAGARAAHSEGFLDSARFLAQGGDRATPLSDVALRNTTLAVVASSVPLSAAQCTQLARAAGAAIFRRITPAGTAFDGDMVFALAPSGGVASEALGLETMAVAALEEAIERAVRFARGRDGIPGLADAND